MPAPAPADMPFDFSSGGDAVFVAVSEEVCEAVVDALEVDELSVGSAVAVAEDAEDAEDVLVAARRALLSTVHHVGDAVVDAPVALEGCFTSPLCGSTKKCWSSLSQQELSTAPQQYIFLPQSTTWVPVLGA